MVGFKFMHGFRSRKLPACVLKQKANKLAACRYEGNRRWLLSALNASRSIVLGDRHKVSLLINSS
jgi:hypothetical protein